MSQWSGQGNLCKAFGWPEKINGSNRRWEMLFIILLQQLPRFQRGDHYFLFFKRGCLHFYRPQYCCPYRAGAGGDDGNMKSEMIQKDIREPFTFKVPLFKSVSSSVDWNQYQTSYKLAIGFAVLVPWLSLSGVLTPFSMLAVIFFIR